MTPRVVGIDPSITATGIADHHGFMTTIGGDAKIGDKRLRLIAEAVTNAATIWPAGGQGGSRDPDVVDLAVIEFLPAHMKGAGITGMVHGVIRLVLMELAVPYVLIPPANLKGYATGRGVGAKADLRMALYKRTGLDCADEDQVDAAWLRMMGLDYLGHPVVEMPVAHRKWLNLGKDRKSVV